MWDVVIIGAGPAATSAAINILKAGYSCLLVERQRFPRYRPGETLHPGIEPLLRQLGVWEFIDNSGFLRHKGVTIKTDTETRFEQFGTDHRGTWFGLQVSRAELDRTLVEYATRLGAKLLMPCRALRVSVDGARVVGVDTDRGFQRCRFVIDAGGVAHFLARSLSLGLLRDSPPLVVRFGYVEGDINAIRENPLFEIDPLGWTWLSRIREGLLHWARLNVSGECAGLNCDLPKEFAGLKRVGRTRGADVTWRRVTTAAGPGFFIAGDAACVVDPASSNGVIRAIMSGLLAAHLIGKAIVNPEIEVSATAIFTTWIRCSFEREVDKLRGIYDRYFPGWRSHRNPHPGK
jgi:flavin-dependent dehydrogenase